MSYLNEVLTMKVLGLKHRTHGSLDLFDLPNLVVRDENGQEQPGSESPVVKNVCAKLHVALSDRIDETVNLLGISKRSFIEAAIINALQEADDLLEKYQVFESFEEEQAHFERQAKANAEKSA